jgi:hypothetical protein
MHCRTLTAWCLVVTLGVGVSAAEDTPSYSSHPPLRVVAPLPARPLSDGPARFVDAAGGDDARDGSEQSPWRTLAHAVGELRPGDTLYLRGGTYYEPVRIALVGRADAPITIRGYPGESATIDGGLREFVEQPEECWEPAAGGAADEYRSTRRYPNLRNVVASFGDSLVGLHTYFHATDLRADGEVLEKLPDGTDFKPIYCGPGLWYDRAEGRLHARLAHTHLEGVDNYQGETDPRRLPLVIAPYRSVPLHLDGAAHVRLQDLSIRGGGYDTLVLEQSRDIELDQVSVWCGTYGVRAIGVERLRMVRCGLYGNAPPWLTRQEAGFNTYPGQTARDITRLNTHSWLVAQGNGEFEVDCYPFNDDWEIAYCEFCDAGADGLYLGGVNLRFHHNLVDHTRDDGIYFSPMYARHFYLRGGATLHVYQNYFSRMLTALAFGGTEGTQDTIYFYRNVVDLRASVAVGRGSPQDPRILRHAGQLTSDHGSPPWTSTMAYHNTIVVREQARAADLWLSRGTTAERPRRVFNNAFVHLATMPPVQPPEAADLAIDGNLYWQPGLDGAQAGELLAAWQRSPAFESSRSIYPPGFEAASVVADPRFIAFAADPAESADYRLQENSPAIDAGVDLPSDWADPLREQDAGRPDIGALPAGAEEFRVGRTAADE